LTAEVFSARYGSFLNDPALTLFDANLNVIASNDNTQNSTQATNGTTPLFNDPVLFSGLQAGDYYLAVSSSGNMPDLAQGPLPGTQGVFDPHVSHSGSAGYSTFPYVLNLQVVPDSVAPQVIAVSIPSGADLPGPPTGFTVRFSKPVNIQQLSYQQYQNTGTGDLSAVYIAAADGNDYYPRLVSHDSASQTATFVLLDALPPGPAVLHLSGPAGLTDIAGNPLVGNDLSQDYVVPFAVGGPPRGTSGNPTTWDCEPSSDSPNSPQVLGTLFSSEVVTGVAIVRGAGLGSTTDQYQFQVLQDGPYFVALQLSTNLPDGAQPVLTDAMGNVVPSNPIGSGGLWLAALNAEETYTLSLGVWSPAATPGVSYVPEITSGASSENATPLTSGPAPLLRLALASSSPTSPAAALGAAANVVLIVPAATGRAASTAGRTTMPGLVLTVPSGALTALNVPPGGGLRADPANNGAAVPQLILLNVPETSASAGQQFAPGAAATSSASSSVDWERAIKKIGLDRLGPVLQVIFDEASTMFTEIGSGAIDPSPPTTRQPPSKEAPVSPAPAAGDQSSAAPRPLVEASLLASARYRFPLLVLAILTWPCFSPLWGRAHRAHSRHRHE
jgi:hypothetical protein